MASLPDPKGLEGRKEGLTQAPQSRDFLWDSITLYVVAVILALAAIDVVTEFVRGSQVQCYLPNETDSSLLASVQDYVNEFCTGRLPSLQYLPAIIAVHAIAILAPHYAWLNAYGADLDFFFAHVSKLNRTRKPETGDYPEINYVISKQLEDAFLTFSRSNRMYWYYIVKLLFQIALCVVGVVLVPLELIKQDENHVTFECPKNGTDTKGDDWPLPAYETVMCVFSPIHLLQKVWGVYLFLLALAASCLLINFFILIKWHTKELGFKKYAEFSFKSGMHYIYHNPQIVSVFQKNFTSRPVADPSSQLPKSTIRKKIKNVLFSLMYPFSPFSIQSNYDFLVVKLFRTDGGLAYILKEVHVLRLLQTKNSSDRAKLTLYRISAAAAENARFLRDGLDCDLPENFSADAEPVIVSLLKPKSPTIQRIVVDLARRCEGVYRYSSASELEILCKCRSLAEKVQELATQQWLMAEYHLRKADVVVMDGQTLDDAEERELNKLLEESKKQMELAEEHFHTANMLLTKSSSSASLYKKGEGLNSITKVLNCHKVAIANTLTEVMEVKQDLELVKRRLQLINEIMELGSQRALTKQITEYSLLTRQSYVILATERANDLKQRLDKLKMDIENMGKKVRCQRQNLKSGVQDLRSRQKKLTYQQQDFTKMQCDFAKKLPIGKSYLTEEEREYMNVELEKQLLEALKNSGTILNGALVFGFDMDSQMLANTLARIFLRVGFINFSSHYTDYHTPLKVSTSSDSLFCAVAPFDIITKDDLLEIELELDLKEKRTYKEYMKMSLKFLDDINEIWRVGYRKKKTLQYIYDRKVKEELVAEDKSRDNLVSQIGVEKTNYIIVGPVSHPLNMASVNRIIDNKKHYISTHAVLLSIQPLSVSGRSVDFVEYAPPKIFDEISPLINVETTQQSSANNTLSIQVEDTVVEVCLRLYRRTHEAKQQKDSMN